jgi:N-acetyl-gamma-glutamyl-phosphate reductase
MLKVGVVGGTGYTGVELLRLLVEHPGVALQVITSRANVGARVDELFPNLRGRCGLRFTEPEADALSGCDVVFFATPNGTAMQWVPAMLESGTRIIDLAADFRLQDPELWARWYGQAHACPELLSEAVYGLPEMNRDRIRGARLVANPGCYPTAVVLGLLPLMERRAVDLRHLIADAKSGVSGAGRRAQLGTLLCEVSESFKAYAVPGHRHLPEIRQALVQAADQEVGLTFVPHLLPMIRGIHATLYAVPLDPQGDFQALFEVRYATEPFVDVLPAGSHPETRTVRGTNLCRIAVHRLPQGERLVVLSVIDNLIKGAAGQAVQNMNLMFDYDETLGLDRVASLP